MLSLLNIALRNLLNQKHIKRMEFRDASFVAYRRSGKHTDHHLMYLYSKSVIDVYPNRNDMFDFLFNDLSTFHEITNTHYVADKLPPVLFYIPLNYYGKNKANLGSFEAHFTVLLEMRVEKGRISLNIYSPDGYGPDDEFAALKKKLLKQLQFVRRESTGSEHSSDVNIHTHYLNHHTNFSTKGLKTRTDVWLMLYAAKLMEGKDVLLNDGKAISAFKADPLFKFEIIKQSLDVKASGRSARNGYLVEGDKNNHISNKEKSILDSLWESEWSIDVGELDDKSVLDSLTSRSVTHNAEKKDSKEKNHEVVNSSHDKAPELNIVTKVVEPEKHQTLITNQPVSEKYSLDEFRRDIGVTLKLIDKHITVLNNDLKFEKDISNGDKYLKISKIEALQSVLKELSSNNNVVDEDVKKVISSTLKKYPGCKNGLWMGGLFKSRTGILFDELVSKADRYARDGDISVRNIIPRKVD